MTPTTKEETHDRPISGEEVVSLGLMSSESWATVRERALAVFNFGVSEARKRDLILVDTKYEFGVDEATGEILLIDEVHTPDSSRYWKAATYESRVVRPCCCCCCRCVFVVLLAALARLVSRVLLPHSLTTHPP